MTIEIKKLKNKFFTDILSENLIPALKLWYILLLKSLFDIKQYSKQIF
jgi:hypothetical protein